MAEQGERACVAVGPWLAVSSDRSVRILRLFSPRMVKACGQLAVPSTLAPERLSWQLVGRTHWPNPEMHPVFLT